MRKLVLFTFLVLSMLGVNAQNEINFNKVAALQLVQQNKSSIGIADELFQYLIVSSAYTDPATGTTMVYLQQTYKGIPVFNRMQVLAFNNGRIISNTGNLITDASKFAGNTSAPSLAADQAVRIAFAEERIQVPALSALRIKENGQVIEYGKPAGVTEEVIASLLWLPVEKDSIESMKLVWQVQVAPAGKDDVWHLRIDATNGALVEKKNIVIYEDFKAKRTSVSERIVRNGQHFIQPSFGTTFNTNQTQGPSLVGTANYLVIPYPLEAPSFGPAAVRTNPWAAAPGNATSLGWHNDGTDYIISRGNNVWATEDTAATNQNVGLPATSTTSPDPLTFNFTPNYTVEPSKNAVMQQFCITNLFYWNNIIHDITYQYGFDEVAGNYQTNNQGRGGAGNDYVMALAQSGASGHIGNNANFLPSVDGIRGRMRMYLFNSATTLHVNTPPVISGDYACAESAFSTENKLAAVGPVTGQVVYYDDPGGTHEACGAAANSVSGKIALIIRGNCNFTQKVKNAQLEGAIAVIMVNNVPASPLVLMGGDDNTITIPAVFISQENGNIIAAQLANNVNVTLSGTAVLDGDLDAGIIVHEYTHGISNRLTGGPATASCLQNSENGGEGWSDYVGMMLTTNWSTQTVSSGTTPRPLGTYVVGELPTGEGIRNYSYSTNLAVSPLTYAHMGISGAPWLFSDGNEVHNIGEIWCAALWDMTWGIIQQENSINPNLYNFSLSSTGGNSIAFKLVMEGMKLQQCSPGFLNSRNAILTADMNLYGGRHQCAIWTAFARRGMGYSAVQGSSNSTTDQTAAFDLPPAPSITTQPVSVSVLPGDNANFNVIVTAPVNGASILYNWQVSTDGGSTWNNVSPANTTNTLSLTAVTVSMNGYRYRCVLTQGCATVNSSVAILTVAVPAGFTFSTPAPTVASCPAPNTMDVVLGTSAFGGFTNAITVTAGVLPAGTTISFIPSATVTPGNSVTVRLTGTAALTPASYVVTITGTATGATTQTRDITYTVSPGTAPAITAQPVNQGVCAGSNTSFSITSASATGFQWQISTDGGATWNNVTNGGVYSGATTSTLTITGVTVSLNNNRYRCIASTVCGSSTSNPGILTVNAATAITGQPANASVCSGTNQTFTVTATGSSLTYQWYISTDGGSTFNILSNGGIYSGATSASLLITGVTAGINNNQYQVVVTGACPVSPVTSAAATITVGTPVSITGQPADVTLCAGANTNFSVTATGAVSYQWQLSTDGGSTYNNISNGGVYSGATTSTLNITGATAALNNNRYRCVISSGCGPVNSAAAILTVNSAPAITGQPANASVCTGTNQTFTATVTGSSLTYQWYISTDGGSTFNILPNGGVYSGATTSSLTITGITNALNNNQYRVEISGVCPVTPVTSNAATLTVTTTLSITGQPADVTICETNNASFTVTASGAGSYQWQLSIDGGATWNNVTNGGVYSGATTATLTLTGVTPALNGNRYRVNLTSGCGNATSTAAILTVNSRPVITTQPANATVCAGANNTFTVVATGTGLTYQWEISTNGCAGPFVSIPLATSSSYTLNAITTGQNNTAYRCVVTGTCAPAVTSNCALLTVVSPATVTGQPASQEICEGSNTSFTVTGAGAGIIYQWQVSTDGGVTYTNVANGGVYSGATSATLNITAATISLNGNRYRCQLSNATCTAPVASTAAILTVNRLTAITAQPQNATICAGGNNTFTATAAGTNLTYQWQLSTTGCAGTWANISNGGVYSGATSAALTITNATTAMNGYAYRLVITGACLPAVTSSCVSLTVGSTVSITTQPTDQTVCSGSSPAFTVTGNGAGIVYQWQVSTDGGVTWNSIAGATSATLTVSNTTTAMSNNRYRVLLSTATCNVPAISSVALLTVRQLPTVGLTAAPYTALLPGQLTTLTATPSASSGGVLTYTWLKDGNIFFNATNSYVADINKLGAYQVTIRETFAGNLTCSNQSAIVNITAAISDKLFIFPSPNDGLFSVSYYNNGGASTTRTVSVYDSKGAKVYFAKFPITGPYTILSVNLQRAERGLYYVVVGDNDGKRLATGEVLIQR